MRDGGCWDRTGVGCETEMDGAAGGGDFVWLCGDGTGGTGARGDGSVRLGSEEAERCFRGPRYAGDEDDASASDDNAVDAGAGAVLERAEPSADFVRFIAKPAAVGDEVDAGTRLMPDEEPATADGPFAMGTRLESLGTRSGVEPRPVFLLVEALELMLPLLAPDPGFTMMPSVFNPGSDGLLVPADAEGCKTPRLGPVRSSAEAVEVLPAPADAEWERIFGERVEALGPGIADAAEGLGIRVGWLTSIGEVGGVANGVEFDDVELRREEDPVVFPPIGGDIVRKSSGRLWRQTVGGRETRGAWCWGGRRHGCWRCRGC